jgi:hypothetical protein
MPSFPLIDLTYEIYKFSIETNNKIAKRFRYSLGTSIEESILELLDNLIMAKNAPKPHRYAYLLKAVSIREILVLKFRLLLELKLANETRIFQTQAKLEEVGRMLGGWLRSI